MSDPVQAQFRITPFPPEPLPLPMPEAMFGEVFVADRDDVWVEIEPPRRAFGETYLELYALDLDDDDAITKFVERWGPLGVRHPVWAHEFANGYMGFVTVDSFSRVLTERVAEQSGVDPMVETVVDFRLGAWCIRDMTTAWRVLSDDLEEDAAVWETPCWANSVSPVDSPWKQDATPAVVLSTGMPQSLRPFAPTVNFHVDGYGLVDPRMFERTTQKLVPYFELPTQSGVYGEQIPLFSICCLELFNHIAEGASYRLCGNETCQRFFVRQLGRAEQGQFRGVGVKYCSPECKQAQVQREYRRRKRRRQTG